jgi:hypothetical protein
LPKFTTHSEEPQKQTLARRSTDTGTYIHYGTKLGSTGIARRLGIRLGDGYGGGIERFVEDGLAAKTGGHESAAFHGCSGRNCCFPRKNTITPRSQVNFVANMSRSQTREIRTGLSRWTGIPLYVCFVLFANAAKGATVTNIAYAARLSNRSQQGLRQPKECVRPGGQQWRTYGGWRLR